MHRKFALLFTLVALAAAPTLAQAKKGLTVDDMLAMQRVSEPDVSPDGRLVTFTVRDTDLDANRGRTDVWLASTDGAWARRHTTHPDGDSSPRFTSCAQRELAGGRSTHQGSLSEMQCMPRSFQASST